MTSPWPLSLPECHRGFLRSMLDRIQRDDRIAGVAAGGSFISDSMDEQSDLDLVIAVEPGSYEQVMRERRRIAGGLGPLLAAFTGEHIGEPRLLICLYDCEPILHVDLKFVALPDLSERVEDPFILWDRDGQFAKALKEETARYPVPDPQWIEDRFWVWVHYITTKIRRGELFEALEGLSYLRNVVLGPLALLRSDARPAGLRRFEQLAPASVHDLQVTVAGYDAADAFRALRASITMYRTLRAVSENLIIAQEAEEAVTRYLSDAEQRHAGSHR